MTNRGENMASSEIIDLIIQATAESLVYLMPVIALLSGIMLLLSFLFKVTLGAVKNV